MRLLCLIKHKWSPWHWRRDNKILINHLNRFDEHSVMVPGMRKCRRCGKRESAYSFPKDGE